MSATNTVSALKEEISLMSAQIKANTEKITSLYQRMETVALAIKGCERTLEGLTMLSEAYSKARVNDLAAFEAEFSAVNDFCAGKLPRWQQYWVDLNNEAAQLTSTNKALMFRWEEKRGKYNQMVKVSEKQGAF